MQLPFLLIILACLHCLPTEPCDFISTSNQQLKSLLEPSISSKDLLLYRWRLMFCFIGSDSPCGLSCFLKKLWRLWLIIYKIKSTLLDRSRVSLTLLWRNSFSPLFCFWPLGIFRADRLLFSTPLPYSSCLLKDCQECKMGSWASLRLGTGHVPDSGAVLFGLSVGLFGCETSARTYACQIIRERE